MATMKSNNAAIAAMQQMLQERIIAEPALAIKLANPKKSLESAINYLCHEIQKSGMSVVDDQTVLSSSCISMTRTASRMAELLSTATSWYPSRNLPRKIKPNSKSRLWSSTSRNNSENSADNLSRRFNPSRPPPLPKPEQRLTQSPTFLMNSKHPQDYETP